MKKKIIFASMGMVALILISSMAYHRASAASNNHTKLLFNFVTNYPGWETEIAISNTSMDPFSTAHQSGTCTLHFYPGASTCTTPTISAGGQWTGSASAIAPAFVEGYVIADCDFHCAHGMALISNNGVKTIAVYPALVLTLPRPSPESLGQ